MKGVAQACTRFLTTGFQGVTRVRVFYDCPVRGGRRWNARITEHLHARNTHEYLKLQPFLDIYRVTMGHVTGTMFSHELILLGLMWKTDGIKIIESELKQNWFEQRFLIFR